MTPNLDRHPDRIGPWILGRRLGVGGFGVVFEVAHAQHPEVRRALKWIPTSDPQLLARFHREAELLARVEHPGIVRVHEAGQLPQGAYLVLELVTGRSLRALIADDPSGLPFEPACALMIAIARAVGAAHALGVCHRDLKPENVLVQADGKPRVLDFGLALAADKERLTLSGMKVGTLGYMPLELIDGKRAEQGPRTDVFALGVIFHELLTGERPFAGTELQIVGAMARAKLPSVTGFRREIPRWVDLVIHGALSPRLARRPADGEAFARAIEAGLSGALTRLEKRRVRLFAAAWAVALAILLGVACASRALLGRQQETDARATALADEVSRVPLGQLDAAKVAELERRRSALPAGNVGVDPWRQLERGLALLERRLALHSPDEARAAQAAHELLVIDAGALANRDGGALVLDEALTQLRKAARADPRAWGAKLEGLPGANEIARRIVRSRFEKAKSAATPAERLALLRNARETERTELAALAEKWWRIELAPTDSLDAAIDFGVALHTVEPSSAALSERVAALLLRRCELRRATDARGALADRAQAAAVFGNSSAPLWYEGYVQGLVRRGSRLDARPEERALLLAAACELTAEDAAWGLSSLDSERIVAAIQDARVPGDTSHDVETAIVLAWIKRFNRDYPDTEPLREPLSVREPEGRLRIAWNALERRSWRTTEQEPNAPPLLRATAVQARPPVTTFSPEAVAAALAVKDVVTSSRDQVPTREASLQWLEDAFKREIGRADETGKRLAANPTDEDLRLSHDIELMRAASIRETAGEILYDAAMAGEKTRAQRSIDCQPAFDLVREAIRINPAGNDRAFWNKIRLGMYLSHTQGVDLPAQLLALRETIESDALYVATVNGSAAQQLSLQTDISRASFWFAFAYLEVDPPDFEKAELERQRGRLFADREFELSTREILLGWDEELRKLIASRSRK